MRKFVVLTLLLALCVTPAANAQTCPPPANDGFVAEYVDPAISAADMIYMMADMEVSWAKNRYASELAALNVLQKSLDNMQGVLDPDDYDFASGLLEEATADLQIGLAFLAIMQSSLDSADTGILAADAAYSIDDFESAYAFANSAYGSEESVIDMAMQFESCVSGAGDKIAEAANFLSTISSPPPMMPPPMMPPPTMP